MAQKKKKKAVSKKKTGTKRRRGVKLQPTNLTASELGIVDSPPELQALEQQVEQDGGTVLGRYREPLGGHAQLFVALPIDRVEPTPFQRDVSDAHARKLTRAMDKTKRFLDPVIVVHDDGRYFTPNGNHRLTVLKELGASAVVALLVPDKAVAYQILALNIEKAHNLRERATEVRRMVEDLATWSDQKEKDLELELEEPALVSLGFAYAERGRFSGGAYHPAIKKVDAWIPGSLSKAVEERKRRAGLLLELDDAVGEAVKKLKDQGLTSPYLKAFVVARVNPLRFIKGDLPSFDELLETMDPTGRVI